MPVPLPAAVRGHLEAARRRPSPAAPAARRPTAPAPGCRTARAISAISSGRAMAAVLTPTLSAPARSSASTSATAAHAAADGQRDEHLLGGAPHHVVGRLAAARGRGDVEERQLVGALLRRSGAASSTGSPASRRPGEVDALDHPAGVDVQARDDTNGEATPRQSAKPGSTLWLPERNPGITDRRSRHPAAKGCAGHGGEPAAAGERTDDRRRTSAPSSPRCWAGRWTPSTISSSCWSTPTSPRTSTSR